MKFKDFWKTITELPLKKLSLVLVLVVSVALISGNCKKKKQVDDERIKAKVDNFKVHLYVGAKAAIADAGSDADLKAAKDAIMKMIAGEESGEGLSKLELLKSATHLLKLKKTGAELIRSGNDKNIKPILPILLGEETSAGYDANEEHARIMFYLALLKFHPKVPLPIPPEIILYEAYRTDPDALKEKKNAVPFHALKSYVFATNELCDYAAKETEIVFAAPDNKKDFTAIFDVLSAGGVTLTPEELKYLTALFEGISHGSVSLCYFKRGEDKKGNESLGRFLDVVENAGLVSPETELLRAYLECGQGEEGSKKAMARLDTLSENEDQGKSLGEQIASVKEYCESSSKAKLGIFRKVAMAKMVFKVSFQCAEQAGLLKAVEETAVFKKIRSFYNATDTLQTGKSKTPSGEDLKDTAKGLKDTAKGLFNKITE
ncbi:MAG: hypothetical protein GY754_25510 [bacterium]|nr:hypothetical protein [bacterium]